MIISDFRPKVEILPFLHMRNDTKGSEQKKCITVDNFLRNTCTQLNDGGRNFTGSLKIAVSAHER